MGMRGGAPPLIMGKAACHAVDDSDDDDYDDDNDNDDDADDDEGHGLCVHPFAPLKRAASFGVSPEKSSTWPEPINA